MQGVEEPVDVDYRLESTPPPTDHLRHQEEIAAESRTWIPSKVIAAPSANIACISAMSVSFFRVPSRGSEKRINVSDSRRQMEKTREALTRTTCKRGIPSSKSDPEVISKLLEQSTWFPERCTIFQMMYHLLRTMYHNTRWYFRRSTVVPECTITLKRIPEESMAFQTHPELQNHWNTTRKIL